MISPNRMPAPRPPAVRTGRNATQTRLMRTSRKRYAGMARFIGVLGVVVVLVMVYLALMANLTSLNYNVANAYHERLVLQDETTRLEDRIAQLQSRERLARIAAKLGMRDPHVYAVVSVPDRPKEVAPKPRGVALLGAMTDWLKAP